MNAKIMLLVSLIYYKIKTIIQIRDIIDSIQNITKI